MNYLKIRVFKVEGTDGITTMEKACETPSIILEVE
jgi:hypothetical protein